MLRLSPSNLSTVAICPPSASLATWRTRSDSSDRGNAGHEYLAILIREGREQANAAWPAIVESYGLSEDTASYTLSQLAKFDPGIPRELSTLVEQALCLLDDGSVVEVAGGKGWYNLPDNAVIAGTLDVAWVESAHEFGVRVAAVSDHKFGDDRHRPVVENDMQALTYGLFAQRHYDAEEVAVYVDYPLNAAKKWHHRTTVNADGEVVALPYTAAELAAFEVKLRGIVQVAREEHARIAEGKTPRFVKGPHCGTCPARSECPAYLSQVVALAQSAGIKPAGRGAKNVALTQEQRVFLATWLGAAEAVTRTTRAALIADVTANGPIPLADGRVWGPQESEQTAIVDPLGAFNILSDIIGAEHARGALSLAVGGASEAIAANHAERGIKRGVSGQVRRFLAIAYERGVATKKAVTKYQAHHPGAAEEEDNIP